VDGSCTWSALCARYAEIRGDAHAYDLGSRWRRLVDATRAGTATLTEWDALLDEIETRADEELNFISKGDARARRLVALRATGGDFVCPAGLCDRSALEERADRAPACPLLETPMVAGRGRPGHVAAR
jgi:hypothetical protein